MAALIGRKIGMTQIYDQAGTLVPVTVVQAGPCYIVQVKKEASDGYCAVQIGYEKVPEKKLTRPVLGHLQKKGIAPLRILKEFRVKPDQIAQFSTGQELTVEQFKPGDYVDVTGTSIGKGFQGVVKRHHFKGGPATHGSMSHRAPGSIGNTAPQRVVKGRRMAGHMGSQRVTVQNLSVVAVIPEDNCLLLRGSIPGPKQSVILIRSAVKKMRTQ